MGGQCGFGRTHLRVDSPRGGLAAEMGRRGQNDCRVCFASEWFGVLARRSGRRRTGNLAAAGTSAGGFFPTSRSTGYASTWVTTSHGARSTMRAALARLCAVPLTSLSHPDFRAHVRTCATSAVNAWRAIRGTVVGARRRAWRACGWDTFVCISHISFLCVPLRVFLSGIWLSCATWRWR